MNRSGGREARARNLLKLGAGLTVVGVGFAVAGDTAVSRWLTVLGLVLLVVGLHRFGRLGAETPPAPR